MRRLLLAGVVLPLLLTVASATLATGDNCSTACTPTASCGKICEDGGNPITCRDWGTCADCSVICTPSTVCGKLCYDAALNPTTCGNFGVCDSGGGLACSSVCSPSSDCATACDQGSLSTTCGGYGLCDDGSGGTPSCFKACKSSSDCSTPCSQNGTVTSCGDYGLCGSGGGGPEACSAVCTPSKGCATICSDNGTSTTCGAFGTCDSGGTGDPGPGGGGPVCGDGKCEPGEEMACRKDCGRCRLVCDHTPDHQCETICFPDYDGALAAFSNLPSCVTAGKSFTLSVTMRNTGTTTWSAADGYKLGAKGDEDPFTSETRVLLPPDLTVPPLATHTFQVAMTAPSTNGDYLSDWQMVRENVAWFGIPTQKLIHVSSTGCAGPGGAGDYFCKVSIRHADGSPSTDKTVAFDAYVLDKGGEAALVDHREAQTDVDGNAFLAITSPDPVQQLVCEAFHVRTTQIPRQIVTVARGIPKGTTLDLNLTEVSDFVPRIEVLGLKSGNATARLFQSGLYDRPVVVPTPFDFGEQTPNRFTEDKLYDLFSPFMTRAYDRGYDVWLVKTKTGQNIHEQAAEFAQVIDEAARRVGPAGSVIVAGYSLGGVTARLSTARYEASVADGGWTPDERARLGLGDHLPASLVSFGDSPLEGAQANLCLQEGVWELGRESEGNLNSCGAQQLLRKSFPGARIGGLDLTRRNYERFFFTGSEVEFFPKRFFDGVCDRRALGSCFCDAGPAVLRAGASRNGFADRRLVAFSGGAPGPMMCYGDSRDFNRDGGSVCEKAQGPLPRELRIGEPLYRVRVPLASDHDCPAEDVDVEGGSRVGSPVDRKECFAGIICGGFIQYAAGTFIPYSSALPSSAPFFKQSPNTFQGVHANVVEPGGGAPLVDFLLNEFDNVTSTGQAAVSVSVPKTSALEVRPPDSATGAMPLTITLPNVLQAGVTSMTVSASGPSPFPQYVPGTPPTYYDVTTTTIYEATPNDPINICVDYGGLKFTDEEHLALFHYESVGWVDITSLIDRERQRVCGTTTSLSPFALFEPENHEPVANAGDDQIVEATSAKGAEVLLSGALSIDPDLEGLHFEWRDDAGSVFATTAVVRQTVPLGTHRLTLQASDRRGGSGSASVNVRVQDTTPPAVALTAPVGRAFLAGRVTLRADASDAVGVVGVWFEVDGKPVGADATDPPYSATWDTKTVPDGSHALMALARDAAGNVGRSAPVTITVDNTPPTLTIGAMPTILWPPNHTLVTITMAVTARDNITANPVVRLVAITCDDACNPASDVMGAAYSTDDRQFALLATRLGTGSGRTYKITYSATDQAGNATVATTMVVVPHDQRPVR